MTYDKGLHELGDGLHAYLQPDGSWGWSNAGLIAAGETSLLVDTLFDLALTREMLASMRPLTERRPIASLLNTHGDGDHCWGNELVPADARIYATSAAVADMQELSPQFLHGMLSADLGPELGPFAQRAFGPFRFDDITLRLPDETVDAPRTFDVGGRAVEFIPIGPAHTAGDALVHVPDAGVIFTGDVLFVGGTPITWHGPVAGWIAACDRILALRATTLVPGHGPITDAAGVRGVQRYLRYVEEEARQRHAAGMSVEQATDDIELGEFADWPDAERIVANVDAVYRELEPDRGHADRPALLARMAAYGKRHRIG